MINRADNLMSAEIEVELLEPLIIDTRKNVRNESIVWFVFCAIILVLLTIGFTVVSNLKISTYTNSNVYVP